MKTILTWVSSIATLIIAFSQQVVSAKELAVVNTSQGVIQTNEFNEVIIAIVGILLVILGSMVLTRQKGEHNRN